VHLIVLHPNDKKMYRFVNERFDLFQPTVSIVQEKSVSEELFEATADNISPFIIES
jgi:hypothetical protein